MARKKKGGRVTPKATRCKNPGRKSCLFTSKKTVRNPNTKEIIEQLVICSWCGQKKS